MFPSLELILFNDLKEDITMALFGFGKKKEEEKKTPACCCGSNAPAEESVCCGKSATGTASIKVLGAGCKSCHEQYENAKAAVKALGLSA